MQIRALLFLLLSSLILSSPTASQDDAFLPTWKLLSRQEKQHFVSGYLQGWRDAQKVVEIAGELARENPETAKDSLDKLRSIYDMESLRPDSMAEALDRFFSDPDNAGATLSKAMSAARQSLR